MVTLLIHQEQFCNRGSEGETPLGMVSPSENREAAYCLAPLEAGVSADDVAGEPDTPGGLNLTSGRGVTIGDDVDSVGGDQWAPGLPGGPHPFERIERIAENEIDEIFGRLAELTRRVNVGQPYPPNFLSQAAANINA